MKSDNKAPNDRLRAWRVAAGLTFEQAGALLQIDRSNLCAIESGRRPPPLHVKMALAKMASIAVEDWE